jgi:predicted MFS family arabinose efflux permease
VWVALVWRRCCVRLRLRLGADRVSRGPGVAGALLTPSSLAVIVATFPEKERGAAIGTWTAWGTIAGALRPLVAELILNVASWRWIFVMNVPLVVACLWLILRAVPATGRANTGRRVDVVGAVLCVLGLSGTVFALIEQPRLGWSNPAVNVSLIAVWSRSLPS